MRWCQFHSDPSQRWVSHRFMLCSVVCITASLRETVLSPTDTAGQCKHCDTRSRHHSALCYIQSWLAKPCKVQYGWPGGFAYHATRPLAWKLTTHIQNEVRAGLPSSVFIKDWEFCLFFFFLPSHIYLKIVFVEYSKYSCRNLPWEFRK